MTDTLSYTDADHWNMQAQHAAAQANSPSTPIDRKVQAMDAARNYRRLAELERSREQKENEKGDWRP